MPLGIADWLNPWAWSGHDLALLTAIGTVGAVAVAVSGGLTGGRARRCASPSFASRSRRLRCANQATVEADALALT